MEIYKSNINLFWGDLIIEELARAGIDYFCISPGSRSTPLTVTAATNKKVRTIICYDERAAGFHALGYARATGKPAVVICTSGTAVANYFPAVIEGHQSTLPLIILSADRPPELRATAANQTIDQVKMFGNYLNWQFDLPCPDEKIPPASLLALVDQAVYRASRSPAGPVQINCMFREPFEPDHCEVSAGYVSQTGDYRNHDRPFTLYHQPQFQPAQEDLAYLLKAMQSSERNLLVLGRLNGLTSRQQILGLIDKLNWPVIADITSGLRASVPERLRLNYYDQLLLNESFRQELQPGLVLHLGGPLTSKRYATFIGAAGIPVYIQVEKNPYRQDAQNVVSSRFECDIAEFSFLLNSALTAGQHNPWLAQLKKYDQQAEELLHRFVASRKSISEISLACMISRQLPAGNGLFLANSMPIRDMDMYACFKSSAASVAANRGASGIDGNLASACGYAAGLQKPVTIICGDLALLHDLNSLELVKKLKVPVIIVVINNHGGGIFSFLPAVKFSKIFESHFATAHDLGFKSAAEMFKIDYYRPTGTARLVKDYRKCLQNKKPALIEIITARNENLQFHQNLQGQFRKLTV